MDERMTFAKREKIYRGFSFIFGAGIILIAIGLSEKAGGVVYLTAVIVILAGIFGAVTVPWFLKMMGIFTSILIPIAVPIIHILIS